MVGFITLIYLFAEFYPTRMSLFVALVVCVFQVFRLAHLS